MLCWVVGAIVLILWVSPSRWPDACASLCYTDCAFYVVRNIPCVAEVIIAQQLVNLCWGATLHRKIVFED